MSQEFELEEEYQKIGEVYKPTDLCWRDRIFVNCTSTDRREAVFLGYLKGSNKSKIVAIPRNSSHSHVYEDWSSAKNTN